MNNSICNTCVNRGCPFNSNIIKRDCAFYQAAAPVDKTVMKTHNPERISIFCNQLAEAWGKAPHLRLGQLLCNVFNINNRQDIFYMDDDECIEYIKNYINFIKIDFIKRGDK